MTTPIPLERAHKQVLAAAAKADAAATKAILEDFLRGITNPEGTKRMTFPITLRALIAGAEPHMLARADAVLCRARPDFSELSPAERRSAANGLVRELLRDADIPILTPFSTIVDGMSAHVIAEPFFGAAHLRGELVLADADRTSSSPVWIQIARTGKWMGHAAHPKGVEFTRETFDQVVANLHANPAFKVGPGGVGIAPVVPFDYEHASEMDPTHGTIPTNGAPAPAWVLDAQVRASADGQSYELWALADLGEKVREQIANNEYRWTSVSIWPNARDATTNKPIGALLTSVAFTNHPFIQGMTPVAVSATARAGATSMNSNLYSGYPGRNDIERVMAYLADTRLGFKQKQRIDQVHEAGAFLASLGRGTAGTASFAAVTPSGAAKPQRDQTKPDPTAAQAAQYAGSLEKLRAELQNLTPLVEAAMAEDAMGAQALIRSYVHPIISADIGPNDETPSVDAAMRGGTLDLRSITANVAGGGNAIQRVMTLLAHQRPGFKNLHRIDQVHEAGRLLRAYNGRVLV